jgi:cation transport regulator ChaC
MSGVWVFGYGSLVSPESFGATIGRDLRSGIDLFEAELAGYGRRWNYALGSSSGRLTDGSRDEQLRTIIALGLVAADDEAANGIIGWVRDDEVGALDRRERRYDRVDVTALTTSATDVEGPIVTYVPRLEAVDDYEAARDQGVAAIELRYWDLVDHAFGELGPRQLAQYRATTPPPDVPILEMTRVAGT